MILRLRCGLSLEPDPPPNQATTHDAFPMYVDAAESKPAQFPSQISWMYRTPDRALLKLLFGLNPTTVSSSPFTFSPLLTVPFTSKVNRVGVRLQHLEQHAPSH